MGINEDLDPVIKMPRGDIRPVRFIVINSDGSPSGINFDEIYFTVKNNYFTKEFLFQKKLSDGTIQPDEGGYQLVIRPEDTDNLKIGKYVFDIEIIYGDEIKQTTVGDFVLTNEVTFASNEG